MRVLVALGLIVLSILTFFASAFSFELSADMIIKDQTGVKKGKLYIKGDKQRMEAEGQAVTIVRPDKKMAWMLMPQDKSYVEMPMDPNSVPKQEPGSKLKDEVSRKFIADEKIDGLQAKKYEVMMKSGPKTEKIYQWVLADMDFPIKMAEISGVWSIEYKNIKKTVPDSLFEVPPGYEKISVPLPPGFPGIPEDDPPAPAKK